MNENFIKKNIIINSFIFEKNYLNIDVKNDNNKYILNIVNGSVDANIKTYDNVNVGLRYLEKGDLIKIKGINLEKNKIIITKIYIKTKYIFNSESSEDLELY